MSHWWTPARHQPVTRRTTASWVVTGDAWSFKTHTLIVAHWTNHQQPEHVFTSQIQTSFDLQWLEVLAFFFLHFFDNVCLTCCSVRIWSCSLPVCGVWSHFYCEQDVYYNRGNKSWGWRANTSNRHFVFSDFVLTKLRAQWVSARDDTSCFYPIAAGALIALCPVIGWDGRESYLQSSGCQPGERADDGGLRETGQRCKFNVYLQIFVLLLSEQVNQFTPELF